MIIYNCIVYTWAIKDPVFFYSCKLSDCLSNESFRQNSVFFSCLPMLNLIKLFILMQVKSLSVLTCNSPHDTVFKASRKTIIVLNKKNNI